MAETGSSPPSGVVVRKLVLTVLGVFLFALGLTLLFLGMRAVMDVGGSCGSGGPYEIRQECPDGAWLMVVGIFVGLFGTGLAAAGTFANGPQLWTLAWPALFCSLGWNFLEYGIDPPPPDTGVVWGWIVCAVAFLAMGGIPLLLVVLHARTVLWGRGDGPAATPRAAMASLRRPAGSGRVERTPVVVSSAGPATGPSDPGDLVSDLERLSALHRQGALSDREFARAKAARLTQEET